MLRKLIFFDNGKEMPRVKTTHYPKLFDEEEATALYKILQAKVPWEDGIYSKQKKRVTRKALGIGLYPKTLEDVAVSFGYCSSSVGD